MRPRPDRRATTARSAARRHRGTRRAIAAATGGRRVPYNPRVGAIRELSERFWSGAVPARELWKPTGASEEIVPGVVFLHAFANGSSPASAERRR